MNLTGWTYTTLILMELSVFGAGRPDFVAMFGPAAAALGMLVGVVRVLVGSIRA